MKLRWWKVEITKPWLWKLDIISFFSPLYFLTFIIAVSLFQLVIIVLSSFYHFNSVIPTFHYMYRTIAFHHGNVVITTLSRFHSRTIKLTLLYYRLFPHRCIAFLSYMPIDYNNGWTDKDIYIEAVQASNVTKQKKMTLPSYCRNRSSISRPGFIRCSARVKSFV